MKHFAFISTIIMLCCTALQSKAYDIKVGDLYYNLYSDYAAVTYESKADLDEKYNGYKGDITIPTTIENEGKIYPVTIIGDSAFLYSSITSINIPEGIEKVNKKAFSFCLKLKDLTLPNSVTYTGFDCAAYCEVLETVTIGNGMQKMEQGFCYSSPIVEVNLNATTPPSISSYVFSTKPTINVKVNALKTYLSSSAWVSFGNIVSTTDAAYTYDDIQALLPEYGEKEYAIGTTPGYYTEASVNKYNEAVANAKAMDANSNLTDTRAAAKALLETQPEYIDIKEGYYRIISAGNGSGYNDGPYNYENKVAWYNADGIVKWQDYSSNEYSMIYKIMPVGDEYTIFNLRDKSYVDKGEGAFNCKVKTADQNTKQIITLASPGKFIIKSEEATYIYSMTNSHNGSNESKGELNIWGTIDEAVKYGVNVWYLQPVSQEIVDYLEENDDNGTYLISQTESEPVAGKKYVVKNAFEEYYLNSSGALTTTVSNELEYFWELEESGKSVDGHPTYYIKSNASGNYWQYVDYASQTWNGTSPYDGYDWYDYAGLNAEFGAKETAMEVTVLAAGSTNDWHSSDASKGYVIAMRDPVVCAGSTYYYKLGHQTNNVGMEPWKEDVGWLFYLVSNAGDTKDLLETALTSYGNLNTDINTSDDPGFYSTKKIETYKTALATAQALTGNESKAQIKEAVANLKDAYESALEVNPIKEGFFYIVSAGNGPGYNEGPYNDEWKVALYNEDGLVRWKTYDPMDFTQIYSFSKNSDGNWNISSALNSTYIEKGVSNYSTTVTTGSEPTYSQMFESASEGKFVIKATPAKYIYAVKASHNGVKNSQSGTLNVWGTVDEAKKYAVNVWYVHQVPDSVMTLFSKTDVGLASLCSQYESMANSLEVSDKPGYYIESNVEALKDVIKEARALAVESSTEEERTAIRQKLQEAYEKALEVNPLTDGYYYLINNYKEYKNNFGDYPAIYTAPKFEMGNNGSACYYETFNKNNANFIYKVTKAEGDETFTIENAYTGWYLNTGDGNGSTGEIMTCSNNLRNNQIVKWKSVGKYWIADETDNSVGHAIANAVSVNKRDFIVEATSFDSNVSTSLNGYNTWSLESISEEDAKAIIEAQKAKDIQTEEAFNSMVSYNDSVLARINTITNDKEGNFNSDAVILLKSYEINVQTLINSHSYDITSTPNDYALATENLKDALDKALNTKPDSTSMQQLVGEPIGAISVDYNTSQQSTTVNTPVNVFDSDYTTYYASYDRSTGWVGLDLGEKYIIKKIAYAPKASQQHRMVLGVFEGGNKEDFSDAIPFYIIKDAPEYDKMTYQQVDCSRGFRYVRYVGPNDSRTNVSEIRFYGEKGEGDDSHLYQLTNLPLVVFRTIANVSEITSKTTWLPGQVNIISDNGSTLKNDSMNIRGRGNGSWSFEKKPYKFKFASKKKVLGMPAKAKTWTLINNYGDKTMIRNNVAFKLSEIFEMKYTPAARLVDVVFNGQYKGSYQLSDQMEVHKNRIEVTEMDADDNAGDSITGGYLIELDAYAGSEPKHFSSSGYNIPVTVHYPESEDITNEQMAYIKSAFDEVCSRLSSANYKDEEKGYAAVLDEESWLKYFLIEELSGNTDGYWSVYMTKDRGVDSKFYTGPVWDFDLAFDNDRRTHPILTMTDFLSLSSKSSAASGVRSFNRKIVESCSKQLTELWSWYRYEGDLNFETLKACVDSLGEENNQSQEYNYMRWNILNTCTQQQYTTRGSYKAEVDYINEYLYDRIAWLDNKVGLEEPIGIHSTQDDIEAKGGIHGRDGQLLVRGFAEGANISVYTTNGTLVANSTVNSFENNFNLPKGIYIVKVTETSGKTTTQKVAIK